MKVLTMLTLMALLTACLNRFWESDAPPRPFQPKDLLIDKEVFPTGWYALDPILPVGDDLATQESVCQGFGNTVDSEQVGSASQCVYRQQNTDVAKRSFEHLYLPTKQHKILLVDEWTYQSVIAEQTFFGCSRAPDGSGHMACDWGGQYEEYIVTLKMRIVPGEVSLADMEKVVREIDLRMSEYLD